MRAICAWCQAEGAPSDLGEREPLDDPSETHGLCQRHQAQLLAELPSRSLSTVRLLIVVERRDQDLHDYLTRGMAGVAGVQVIMDRRYGERRRGRRSEPRERRQADRRQDRGVIHSMGCRFVRLGSDPVTNL